MTGFGYSSLVLADALDQDNVYDLVEIGAYTQALDDVDLSSISGKGANGVTLDGSGGQLAIILWDEGGSDNRRGTNHDINYQQVVNLTVIHK